MQNPAPREPFGAGPSAPQRVLRVLDGVASPARPSKPPDGDLLDLLAEEEERALRRHWPEGGPTGNGSGYYDEVMRIRMGRLRWKSRVETGSEIAWLAGKVVAASAACLGAAVTFAALVG